MQFQTITDFRAKRAAFIAAMKQITADASTGKLTASELSELRSKLPGWSSAGSKFDTVENMIRGVEKVTGNLGALPLIPAAVVAAVAGVTYLLSKTLSEVTDFLKRRSYVKTRTAEGASVATAMQEYASNNPKDAGLFGDLSKLLWPVAIVGGLVLLMGRK
jgi:hypothetical protein